MSVLVALLVAGLGAGPLPIHAVSSTDETTSLEQLLEQYKAKQTALLKTYQGQFDGLVADVEAAYGSAKRERLNSLRKKLVQLGPEATPLFIKKLDPGGEATQIQIARSREIAGVLTQLSTRSISGPLLKMFEKGSVEGRANALNVLSHSDDPDRVGPVFREHYKNAEDKHRSRLISAIANLGGDENYTFIAGILRNEDPILVKSALSALAETRCQAAAPQVLDLVKSTLLAAKHVPEIVKYYEATPEVVDEDLCVVLVEFARSLTRQARMAELILMLLCEYEDEWNSKVKKPLKELAESSDNRISRSARICLARAGDFRMRKRLLDPIQDAIDKNERVAANWKTRADLRYRIADYKGAIKDYNQAQRLSSSYQSTAPEIYIGIASSYAKLGKPKDAAKWIGQGGFSVSRLRSIAKLRVFEELLEDEDHRKVFRLDE